MSVLNKRRSMNVLSLFDGISCGAVALERAGIHVDKYYTSEVDKNAESISKANHYGLNRLGDIMKWRDWDLDLGSIDLILAGFPCQSWSIAGKQDGLEDPRGELALVLSEVFREVKRLNPNVKFLFENVRMKQRFLDFLDHLFGVEHIKINSNLVSAQNRARCYWTNIPNVTQPKDKGIMLKDIVHEERDSVDLEEYKVPFDKTLQIVNIEVERGKVGYFRKDSQANRVYRIHGKAVTLCGEAGGGAAKMGQYLFGCITPDRINKRQNGQRFSSGKKFYTLTAQDKHGVLIDGYIRKLTPMECCRLQTLPDGYTSRCNVSETQQYRALGNGWTVDVIAHILGGLNRKESENYSDS